jgi:hypothetical protein
MYAAKQNGKGRIAEATPTKRLAVHPDTGGPPVPVGVRGPTVRPVRVCDQGNSVSTQTVLAAWMAVFAAG